MPKREVCQPVGVAEIAAELNRLGVKSDTGTEITANLVKIWHHRGKLGVPRWPLRSGPVWNLPELLAHLRETGVVPPE